MMSDTPRTDALITRYIPRNDAEGVMCIADIDAVAAMERELSAVTKERDALRAKYLDVGQYDPETDSIEIEGTRFSGDFFRGPFSINTCIGSVWRVEKRDDGIVTSTEIEMPTDDEGMMCIADIDAVAAMERELSSLKTCHEELARSADEAITSLVAQRESLTAERDALRALMAEAVRDFHGKSMLFSAAFLSATVKK
jgi:hypothetical protein